MDSRLLQIYEELKQQGLTPVQEAMIRRELEFDGTHEIPTSATPGPTHEELPPAPDDRELLLHVNQMIYRFNDQVMLQDLGHTTGSYTTRLRSIDELLERDRLREEDGFPRKIRIGKLVKPAKTGKGKVIVVPTTVEEKFMHDPSFKEQAEEGEAGGTGDGEEGEVIGEQPVRPQEGEGSGPGEGESGPHEMESSAYDLGKILTETFKLPNLKDKGKKKSLTRYTYDLTDRNRGYGQLLDKKATLRKIVETNINLGRLPDPGNIDPTEFLISPNDRVYRILSREKDFESQAVVFFLRDYSGSMSGKPTELVVSQHVLIYSWLLYQYAGQVETRFVLHDTEAKEVDDFYAYYNSKVAGGTKVASAFKLVNEIVEKENLSQEYNIYVFHGTDGDDWDTEGKETLPEIEKMLKYSSRLGITIAENSYGKPGETEVQKYLEKSNLLDKQPKLIRLDVMQEDANETRLIDGIKKLIS